MTRATIWLPVSSLRRMVAAAEHHGAYETGGMLVGYEGGVEEIVVTGLIDAGPCATRGKFSFSADGRWQRTQLARVYEESGRVSTFLGDWHSHPNGLPLPSKMDVKTAARTAANERARAPRPVTMIIGRDVDEEWILSAFRYEDTDLLSALVRVFDPDPGDLLAALDPTHRRQVRRPEERNSDAEPMHSLAVDGWRTTQRRPKGWATSLRRRRT